MTGEGAVILAMLGWIIARLEVVAGKAAKAVEHAENPLHPPFLRVEKTK